MVRSLPAQAITPVGLTGNSITALFSSYLSFSKSWELGDRAQVAWPACVALAEGVEGSMDIVKNREYAIGCASLLTCAWHAFVHV